MGGTYSCLFAPPEGGGFHRIWSGRLWVTSIPSMEFRLSSGKLQINFGCRSACHPFLKDRIFAPNFDANHQTTALFAKDLSRQTTRLILPFRLVTNKQFRLTPP